MLFSVGPTLGTDGMGCGMGGRVGLLDLAPSWATSLGQTIGVWILLGLYKGYYY